MPQVDPNTHEPLTDDPEVGDPDQAGGKEAGEIRGAQPSGGEKPFMEHTVEPQGGLVGEKDQTSLGETPT